MFNASISSNGGNGRFHLICRTLHNVLCSCRSRYLLFPFETDLQSSLCLSNYCRMRPSSPLNPPPKTSPSKNARESSSACNFICLTRFLEFGHHHSFSKFENLLVRLRSKSLIFCSFRLAHDVSAGPGC